MIYKTFEEYWNSTSENFAKRSPMYIAEEEHEQTFQAGQASKQPEIDELKAKVKELEKKLKANGWEVVYEDKT